MRRATLAASVFAFFILSCAAGMARNDRTGSLPVREIKVWAALDGRSWNDVRAIIEEASTEMTEEVGVSLSLDNSWSMDIKSSEAVGKVNEMFLAVYGCRDQFDVAMLFSKPSLARWLLTNSMGGILGGMDTHYFRYGILFSMDAHVLKHEIYHSLIGDEHSFGIMTPMQFQPLPFTPVRIRLQGLPKETRQAIIEKKWRDFNEEELSVPHSH